MSKEKQIDDKDLDKISGAGDLGTPATHLNDNTPDHDTGSPETTDRRSGGTGGSGPGGDTDGTDGGGLQDLG